MSAFYHMPSAEELERRAEEHAKQMRLVNSQFAVVADGPSAGEIVSVCSGKRASPKRIDALTYSPPALPFSRRWLLDPERREIMGEELRSLVADGRRRVAPEI